MTLKIRLLAPAALLVAMAIPAAHAATAAPTARNYDCSKAGNANKAVCKSAAKPKPAPAARTYDCTKAGNANKSACKGLAATPAPKAAPAPRPKMTAATTRPATVATASRTQATAARGPQGATAQCNDGSYSHSTVHKGACSHHGGVKQWF